MGYVDFANGRFRLLAHRFVTQPDSHGDSYYCVAAKWVGELFEGCSTIDNIAYYVQEDTLFEFRWRIAFPQEQNIWDQLDDAHEIYVCGLSISLEYERAEREFGTSIADFIISQGIPVELKRFFVRGEHYILGMYDRSEQHFLATNGDPVFEWDDEEAFWEDVKELENVEE